MTQEFASSYNFKYTKSNTTAYARISLLKIPNKIHGASISDEELENDIKCCNDIIDTREENGLSESDVEDELNSLAILNTEMQKRWWIKLEVSEMLSDEDIKYIKYIVYHRYIQACEYQKEYTSNLRTSSTFKALDIVLNLYKEIKNL
jgi:hypothetical protein